MSIFSGSSLGGCQEKYYIDGFVYKEDRLGYESISEALISELESYILGLNFVDYELELLDGKYCCKSKNMLKSGEKLISLHKILVSKDGSDDYLEKYIGLDLKKYVIDGIGSITGLDIEDYLAQIIYLDCITLNGDRHLDNISLIKSKEGYSPSPIYDNGLGLMADMSLFSRDCKYMKCIRDVQSKPFSTNFYIQRKMFSLEPLVIDVDKFYNKIELVEKYKSEAIPFKADCYDRALKILLKRLRDLKDDVWVVR